MSHEIHTLVIGAGQAGLAMGYYLKQRPDSFLLIDAGKEIGDSWRYRYNSLTLFTPRAYSSLPGLPLRGDQHGYPCKDEIADYLEGYADHYQLPIQLNTQAISLEKIKDDFFIQTSKGNYIAQNVIIATGPFQKPYIPSLSGNLSDEVLQIHSAQYTHPNQLKEGPVLVVGAGNSGLQIATELSQTHPVSLSIGKSLRMVPQKILGKSCFWWMDLLGLSEVTIDSKLGKYLKQNDPIIGTEAKPLIKQGKIKCYPRAIRLENRLVHFQDKQSCEVNNLIWATGFHSDYDWIQIPELFDSKGHPIHHRGKTPVEGFYFLGLSWQYRRSSALIYGVGKDAEYLLQFLKSQR
ncbi:flavin-containing monooxygenase [Thermoflavimicrobium daqui]|uniref:flavin-containing monooxygenase n=1 Tax=Thermoflavimicrobium daqui TaxID=2137476 RepID=UPI003B837050